MRKHHSRPLVVDFISFLKVQYVRTGPQCVLQTNEGQHVTRVLTVAATRGLAQLAGQLAAWTESSEQRRFVGVYNFSTVALDRDELWLAG